VSSFCCGGCVFLFQLTVSFPRANQSGLEETFERDGETIFYGIIGKIVTAYEKSHRRKLSIRFGSRDACDIIKGNLAAIKSYIKNGLEAAVSAFTVDDILNSVATRIENLAHELKESGLSSDSVARQREKDLEVISKKTFSKLLINKTEDVFSRENREKLVQKELFAVIRKEEDLCLCLLDCSDSPRNCPFIKLKNGDSRSFHYQGKPDLASVLLPCFIEIKDKASEGFSGPLTSKEYDCIQQVLERIEGISMLNETVKKIFGIATCGRRAWVLVFTRNYVTESKYIIQDLLSIFPIEIKDILPLVYRLNSLVSNDPFFYLSDHMLVLAKLVQKLGFHPGFVRIQLYKNANSSLYLVNPYEFTSTSLELPDIKHIHIGFIIKINKSPGRGLHEATVLKELSEQKKFQKALKYLIGVMTSFTEFTFFDPNYLKRKYPLSFLIKQKNRNYKSYGSSELLFYKEDQPTVNDSKDGIHERKDEEEDAILTGAEEEDNIDNEIALEQEDRLADKAVVPWQDLELPTTNQENKFMVHLSYSSFKKYSLQNYFKCWWCYGFSCGNEAPKFTPREAYTAVVMKAGWTPPLPEYTDVLDMCNVLEEDLQILWNLGFAHTDLRSSNILYFPDLEECRVIDFDHCMRLDKAGNCKITGLGHGERQTAMLSAFPASEKPDNKSEFEWKFLHEKKMLNSALYACHRTQIKYSGPSSDEAMNSTDLSSR
jgi:serine/threonine protein kinase